jgi:hypothetical protein
MPGAAKKKRINKAKRAMPDSTNKNRIIRARLNQLHELYGRDQPLPDLLDGVRIRLERARSFYGGERSLLEVFGRVYAQLDELHQLYGSEPLEEILDGIIERKKRLNRLVELQSKVVVASDEELELQFLRRLFRLYVYRLAMARQMIDQLAILRGP